jgi:hypothetical protein
MRSNKIRQNIDPKPFDRAGEAGTYCLVGWNGPCAEKVSALYVSSHSCKMVEGHKSRHQCSCGVSRMRQFGDTTWKDA